MRRYEEGGGTFLSGVERCDELKSSDIIHSLN